MSLWERNFKEAETLLSTLQKDSSFLQDCQKWSEQMSLVYRNEGNIFSCGNGGSHCDAMHFAEELTGRFKVNRRPLGAVALGDPSHTSCVSNDFGFENVFSRQLEALSRKGDMLVAISTSGNSQNVIKAVEVARKKEVFVVGLLGKEGGALKSMCHLPLVVPSKTTERIQEIHIKLIHSAIESMERDLFPELYT